MAEEPAGQTTQEVTQPAPQEGQSEPVQSAPTGETSQADITRIMAELKEARTEAAKYRTELRSAQEKLSKFEQAQLTEQEKLQKRAEEAEQTAQALAQRLTDTLVRAEVMAQAQKHGVIDLDAAYRLIDRSLVKVGDDGSVEGVDKAVAALVKERPWLVASTTASVTNPQKSGRQEAESNPIIERIRSAGGDPFDVSRVPRR